MFTGIVEEMGTVEKLWIGSSYRLRIRAKKVLQGTKPSHSIAVDGVCLTATEVDPESFSVEIMAQTLNKTNLSLIKEGDKVNLERATSLSSPLGGHIVTGDVDAVGRISRMDKRVGETVMQIEFLPHLARYIVNQGRVSLDGVSLTVADCRASNFSVHLIPFTLNNTTLGQKKGGNLLNLEVDIISKYIEKMIQSQSGSGSRIDGGFLKAMGY
ncbi:MAG: riboflavin synthase [Candidatus Aerophobus sp.]|nr:MAG: riboflavin synthase [Candidatus Aerophobus sp.]